jgi:hypothetical protein
MFPNFQSLLTRFSSELLLRGDRNLSLLTSKENRGGIELASQQRLTRPVFSTRTESHDGTSLHFVAMLNDSIVD